MSVALPLQRVMQLLVWERWFVLLFIFGLGGLVTIGERYSDAFYIIELFLTSIAAFYILYRFLKWIEPTNAILRPRIARSCVRSFFAGFPALVGLLLLLVPGLILYARWSLLWPLIMARDVEIMEGLRSSWRLTRGHVIAIAATTLIIFIPSVLFLGLVIFPLEMNDTEVSFAAELAFNCLFYLSSIASYALSAALHEQLVPPLDVSSEGSPDSRVYA